jgi:hypothetical protein
MSDAGLHLHSQTTEMIRHELGCARFSIAKFRMLVDVTTPGNHFALDLGSASVKVGLQRAGTRSRSQTGSNHKQPQATVEPTQIFHGTSPRHTADKKPAAIVPYVL